MPTIAGSEDCIGFFWTPTMALVDVDPLAPCEDRINDRPRCLNCVLPSEEGSVAAHRVTQQPLVGSLLPWLLFGKVQLLLAPGKVLSRELDASGKRDRGVRREPKAQIVGPAGRRLRILEEPLG